MDVSFDWRFSGHVLESVVVQIFFARVVGIGELFFERIGHGAGI